MCTPNKTGSVKLQKEDRDLYPNLTDVYICVFFDGTSNNLYFPQNERDKLKDNLEEDWEAQKKIAEKQNRIEIDRYKKNSNGNDKYSNVAILYSLAKDFNLSEEEKAQTEGLTSIGYSLYIEGSGANPVSGIDKLGAGFGVGKTGVVALVSKAIRFTYDFLATVIPINSRASVNIHFANFGFSRGSACARLFTQLLVREKNDKLAREKEFKQYLGGKIKLYNSEKDRICFLDDFNLSNITVDFLGIYDTVSSIGFLQREENLTNYGLNQFVPIEYTLTNNAIRSALNLKDSIADGSMQVVDWTRSFITGEVLPDRQERKKRVPYEEQFGNISETGCYVNRLHNLGGYEIWGDAYLNYHRDNVTEYGLYSPRNPKVKSVLHICALDEFRENFALVNLGNTLTANCSEVFIPGCHSDIGGGYIDDDVLVYNKLRQSINNTETKIIRHCQNKKPESLDELESVSIEGMIKTGWFVNKNSDLSEKRSENSKSELNSISIDKDLFGPNTVQMRRFVHEGYSNIALQAMMKRVLDKNNGLGEWPQRYRLFDSLQIKHKRFQIPGNEGSIINKFGNKVIDSVDTMKKGERLYIIPEFDDYVNIRREYIHFTSTDKRYSGLMGKPDEIKARISTIGANIGNPPYWKLEKIAGKEYYILCRLMYNGEKGQRDLATIYDL